MPPARPHPLLHEARYRQFARARTRLSALLCLVVLAAYLAFALAAAFAEHWMRLDVLVDANLGMFLALAVIAVCGLVALIYGRLAATRFDPREDELRRHAWEE